MIEVKDLVKRYGDRVAVDHLSFTVEQGQIYGFLGPNGAGKSTTMNIMTGYLAPTEGTVIVNGHDILKEPEEAKACIGYLPEIPPVYMDMTVQEYLSFAAELKKIPKAERINAMEAVVEKVKLAEVRKRLIRNLSKGYRQRVGLAQALLGFPPILILDEPMVGLDPMQIIEMRELIKELAKEHTVILSSHILSEISAVCDYIMIIAHGKLVASDTPEQLEGKLGNPNYLTYIIKGEKSRIEALFANVDKEIMYDIQEKEDGTCVVNVQNIEDKDIREEIFYACANEKCPILELQKENVTLEDVFLELTTDNNEKTDDESQSADSSEDKEES